MSDTPKTTSKKVVAARYKRACRLAGAFLEWRRQAEQSSYPRSLLEIVERALTREYELGRKAERR